MKFEDIHTLMQKPDVKPDTYEASMALNQLLKIGTHAVKLHNMIDDDSEMEAWVAKKIDLASNYVKSVHGYTAGSKAGTYDDNGMSEAESDYLYHNGKEIDQGSIVYDMQDYSDGIFELQSAKYADGTELDEKELEELESTQELIDWVMIDHVSEDAVPEGNQFAQAVQKAKAAGMKAGDKFKVGDQEYTLKDAIELAGLQLEEFFSEEEMAYDNQIDRIKNLAFYQ